MTWFGLIPWAESVWQHNDNLQVLCYVCQDKDKELYVDWGFTFVCNVKHGPWGTRLSTISVWVSFLLWWLKQVGLGPSNDAASLHCYCRLCPCTVHWGSPPACGRGSSTSNWHAPSVSQQREVLVFPWFSDLILHTWQFFLIFHIWLSGQWHMFLWCDKLIIQIYFCFTWTFSNHSSMIMIILGEMWR